jgi:hypothetical protein
MQDALRILITNNTLAGRAGSELYVRDLALALMRRGHFPIAYSNVLGEVAEELRMATIPVISALEELNVAPDIIHGQHHLETMSAMLHFNRVPTIFVCHGWTPWEETPPVYPAIRRYVAVDDLCRERLLTTPGIHPTQVEVIYNFVDLSRFKQRFKLPVRARSALVFSNYVSEGIQLENIRRACDRMGISKVDVVGRKSGSVVAKPEDLLTQYDLVFAKARCALEALASGCAVVVAGLSGLGGIVTTENMHRMRKLNFGIRTMQAEILSEDSVIKELKKYDAEDARHVSNWIRKNADLENAVEKLIGIYQKTLSEEKEGNDTSQLADYRAVARYLRFLSDKIKRTGQVQKLKNLSNTDLKHLKKLNGELLNRANLLEGELDAIKSSKTWRLLNHYGKMKAGMKKMMYIKK